MKTSTVVFVSLLLGWWLITVATLIKDFIEVHYVESDKESMEQADD